MTEQEVKIKTVHLKIPEPIHTAFKTAVVRQKSTMQATCLDMIKLFTKWEQKEKKP